jgi:GLPGLI family protein
MKTKTLKLGALVLGGALICSFSLNSILEKRIPAKGKLIYQTTITSEYGDKQELKTNYYYEKDKGCTEFDIKENYARVINNFKDTTVKFCVKALGGSIVLKSKWDINGDVKFVNETKSIQGYLCKKAIVTSKVDGLKDVELWYYPESDFQGGLYGGIVGFNYLIFEAKFKLEKDVIECTLLEIDKNTNTNIFDIKDSDVVIYGDFLKIKDMLSNFKLTIEGNKSN